MNKYDESLKNFMDWSREQCHMRIKGRRSDGKRVTVDGFGRIKSGVRWE